MASERPLTNRRRFGDESFMPTEPIALANGAASAEERLEPGTDAATLTAEERAQFGVADDEELAWVRHPGMWEKLEGVDRGVQVRRQGGRIVTDNGVPVTCGLDVMLVAIPREVAEKRRKEELERQRQFEKKAEHQEWEGQLNPEDKASLAARVAQSIEQLRDSKLVGKQSPTARLPMFAVEEGYLLPEEALLMESRARRGGRTPTADEAKQEAEWAEKVARKRSSHGRRFYSIPK